MFTQKHSIERNSKRYLLLLPALLGFGLLVANAQPKEETAINSKVWTFNGNTFSWRESDTLSYDKKAGKAELANPGSSTKKLVIDGMNGEPVYQNYYLATPATYGFFASSYIDHIKKEFSALRKNTPDSLAIVTELNLVVDKNGKVVYYNAKYERPRPSYADKPVSLYPYGDPEPVLNDYIKKIISASPAWKPAMVDGKAVNSFVSVYIPGC